MWTNLSLQIWTDRLTWRSKFFLNYRFIFVQFQVQLSELVFKCAIVWDSTQNHLNTCQMPTCEHVIFSINLQQNGKTFFKNLHVVMAVSFFQQSAHKPQTKLKKTSKRHTEHTLFCRYSWLPCAGLPSSTSLPTNLIIPLPTTSIVQQTYSKTLAIWAKSKG